MSNRRVETCQNKPQQESNFHASTMKLNGPFKFGSQTIYVLPINLLFNVHLFEQVTLVQGQQRRLKILFLADNFLIPSLCQGFTKIKIVEHCLADLTDNAST